MKELLMDFFREVRIHVRAAVSLQMDVLKLRMAIYLSDIKQRAYNKRYFVVLATTGYDKRGMPVDKLRSINNQEFKLMKRKGWLPKRMSYLELSEKCFYSTSLKKNNSVRRQERRKAKERYVRYQRIMNALT